MEQRSRKQRARMLRPQVPPAYVSGWVGEKRLAMVVEFLAWLGSPGLCCSLVSLRFACNSQERTSYYNAGSPSRGVDGAWRRQGASSNETNCHPDTRRPANAGWHSFQCGRDGTVVAPAWRVHANCEAVCRKRHWSRSLRTIGSFASPCEGKVASRL